MNSSDAIVENVVTLSLDCDCAQVESKVPSQRIVEVTVAARADSAGHSAPPLNLALVIDRSGSMKGDKLRCAAEAACHVLDRLRESDRAAIVAYDNTVNIVSPSVSITEQRRTGLKAAIRALYPGGQTDLAGGWLRGGEAIASELSTEGINRILLLTDGLANVGITDQEELSRHAHELRARGVSTSTFGVGADYDEHLLEAMATHGGGHYYYIDRAEKIPSCFQQELGELSRVVAKEAVLDIEIPAGVSLEVVGDLMSETGAGRVRVPLGDLFSGQTRLLYLKLLTPPGAVGDTVRLSASVKYASLSSKACEAQSAIAFTYTLDTTRIARNRPVQERSARVEMAAAATRALGLDRAGQREAAVACMRASYAAAAPHLSEPVQASYSAQIVELEEGMSAETAKVVHAASYARRNSR